MILNNRTRALYSRTVYGDVVAIIDYDRGKPAGFIGLRLEKCRHEETLSIRGAYETAVQTRVMRKQAECRKNKPCLAKRGRL